MIGCGDDAAPYGDAVTGEVSNGNNAPVTYLRKSRPVGRHRVERQAAPFSRRILNPVIHDLQG